MGRGKERKRRWYLRGRESGGQLSKKGKLMLISSELQHMTIKTAPRVSLEEMNKLQANSSNCLPIRSKLRKTIYQSKPRVCLFSSASVVRVWCVLRHSPHHPRFTFGPSTRLPQTAPATSFVSSTNSGR